jgi:hypothetical protein
MTYWEFLIQRAADRAWRPLTSRNLKVSAGTYRLLINTSSIGQEVHTQVFYQTDRRPPQLFHSSSHTVSLEGTLVILPFTHLDPGLWLFNCHLTGVEEDTAALGERCEQLRIQVIAAPIPSSLATPTANSPLSPDTALLTTTPPAEILQTAVADLEALLTNLDRPPEPTPVPTAGDLPLEQAVLEIDRPLQLDNDIFYTQPGEPLLVTGVVNLDHLPQPAHQLVVVVRLPQDGSKLASFQQSCVDRQFSFQVPLDLPAQPPNHFLMGEVALVDRQDLPLVGHNFTIAYEVPLRELPPEALEDPFAMALQIAAQESGQPLPQAGELTLQEILAATEVDDLTAELVTLPLNSYAAASYEVVVDDQ